MTPDGSHHGIFVAGTDTDVGKTVCAHALVQGLVARGLRVAALKPVSAGCRSTPDGLRNDDAHILMTAANVKLPYDLVNPCAYRLPIAPHIAAELDARPIDLDVCRQAYATARRRADFVVVESAGGWLVPLDDARTTEDLALAYGLPVVLVVGIRLGCISHALLSVRAIAASGLRLAGWIANRVQPDSAYPERNIAALAQRIAAPRLGTVAFGMAPDAAAGALNLDPLLVS